MTGRTTAATGRMTGRTIEKTGRMTGKTGGPELALSFPNDPAARESLGSPRGFCVRGTLEGHDRDF